MNNLNEIASAIYNHINAGLKGTGNEPYSIEQLADEVLVERAWILKQQEMAKQLVKRNYIQSINCVPVDCSSIADCCGVETFDKKLHFRIPKPLSTLYEEPIVYVGPVDRSTSFNIIRGPSWEPIVKYTKFNKNKTSVWFLPNKQDGFIFNPPTDDLAFVSVDAMFDNPTELSDYACCPAETLNLEIPQWMISQIIDKLTQRFTQNYYKLQYKPNTQTGH
jgi:hypothetical protein